MNTLLRSTILCLFLLLLPPATLAQSDAAQEPASLAGVWEARRSFDTVSGTLYLLRRGDAWAAEIDGERLAVEARDKTLRFSLPGERGSFRGRLSDDRIVGHWIQPPSRRSSQAFASPVALRNIAPDVWRGEVAVIPDRMTLFLTLTPQEDGALKASLRNPERNVGAFVIPERLVEGDGDGDGEKLTLVGGFRWNSDEQTLAEGRRIDDDFFALMIPDLGGSFDFRRVEPEQASDYFANDSHRLDGANYAYQQPIALSDGWKTATPEDVGLRRAPLEALVQTIFDTSTENNEVPRIHAVLVARSGRLVLEEYFHGQDREETHDTRSASKSLTGLVIGAAQLDPETSVYGVMRPEMKERRELTVRHLMTMSSGLDCDDGDGDSAGNEDRMQSQNEQPDWFEYALDLSQVRPPGEKALYCSAGINLAGGVLARARGAWLPELFHEHLAEPLGIETYHMNLMPTLDAYGGGGLRVSGRDFLKFGQLMLDEGRWNGKQVVPKSWIADSLTPATEMGGEGYDLGWWHVRYPYRDREVDVFYAGGNGGQYILGVPELDLVAVFFGANYSHSAMQKSKREYFPKFILEAVKSPEPRS